MAPSSADDRMGAVGMSRQGWRRGVREFARALADPTASASRAAKLLFGLAALVVGAGLVSQHLAFGPSFYEAVAQVIPVFLLVTVVEARFFQERPHMDGFDQRVRRTLLLLVLTGEAIALFVLARGDDTMALRGSVLVALLIVGALFVTYAFDGPVPDESSSR